MGKGDKKTRIGKIARKSFGNSRPKKKKYFPNAAMQKLLSVRKKVKKISYVNLSDKLNTILTRIPIVAIEIKNKPNAFRQSDTGGLNLLYRARVDDAATHTPWATYDDISYIPDDKLTKIKYFGRVNKPAESMFYCSTDLSTACIETFSKGVNFDRIKKSGSLTLTVGVWKLVDDLQLAQMLHSEKYFNEFRNLLKHLIFKKVSSRFVAKQIELIKKMIPNKDEFEIYKFFSDEFAKTDTHDHLEYQLSNYYSDRVFNRIPGLKMSETLDGIMYPSIPTLYEENNLVLLPCVADTKLEFLWAHEIWVVSRDNELRFIPLKQKVKRDSTGKFNW